MEALMLSVMLAICAENGLSMPNLPPETAYARNPDPLAHSFRESDGGQRVPLAEALAATVESASARSPAAPGVVAISRAR